MAELVEHDPGPRHVLRGPAGGTSLHGLVLPAKPCRAAEVEGFAALWLGPDEFLLLGRAVTACEFVVVDVTHRSLSFRLAGPDAAVLLAGAVALDLAPAAFPVGMCTRTMFEKAEIVLWRRGQDTWHIEVARSFAPYLRDMLAAIRRASPA